MDEDIDLLAKSRGWPACFSEERDFERGRGTEVNWAVTNQLVLGYLESHIANVCCVLAVGREEDEAERLIADVESSLPANWVTSPEDLLRGIRDNSDPRDLARSLVRAGFGAPISFDEGFFEAFQHACTSHPVHNVRSIGLASLVFMEWPDFLPMVRGIEANDPHKAVRDRALIVRRAYEAAYPHLSPPD